MKKVFSKKTYNLKNKHNLILQELTNIETQFYYPGAIYAFILPVDIKKQFTMKGKLIKRRYKKNNLNQTNTLYGKLSREKIFFNFSLYTPGLIF